MAQYASIKQKHPDAVLLFQVGDFYETFGEDAIKCAKILGIVQTKRANGSASEIELAGFPLHALDTYLPKLVAHGLRVAICDQLEPPSPQKKIVKRGVTELISPGVHLNEHVLENKSNNFLAALYPSNSGEEVAVAFLDVSTGTFYVSEVSSQILSKFLEDFSPNEILLSKKHYSTLGKALEEKYHLYYLENWIFDHKYALDKVCQHFGTQSLKGFGIDHLAGATTACGVVLYYVGQAHHTQLAHIRSIQRIDISDYVWMDSFTIRNLEILQSIHPNGRSLLQTLDYVATPMGGRMLKQWIRLPLKDVNKIQKRLDAVEYFYREGDTAQQIREKLSSVGDVERGASRVAMRRVSPRQLVSIKQTLNILPWIKETLSKSQITPLVRMSQKLDPCTTLAQHIGGALVEDAPPHTNKSGYVADGFSAKLDHWRNLVRESQGDLQRLCDQASEQSGITSLKIGMNHVFGYYLEVKNTHKSKVPAEWTRKQTLTNAERYITPELKTYEHKILSAQEQAEMLEKKLYEELVEQVATYVPQLKANAGIIAMLDVMVCMGRIAHQRGYTRPEVNESHDLIIKNGEHPVIREMLPPDQPYVPNSVSLRPKSKQMMMITGPNMSGKSAVLRQTALLVLMAQIGSFVPAQSAKVGVVDKIFTRVGASDNLASGESTFMVEMNETANILNNLSARSLILLDEIGRGTSTFDGISIAWSIARYLHEHPYRPKTMFATHYHEMNDMAKEYGRIQNYNVSVKQIGEQIVFMRTLEPGGSIHSFGIHVAELAGMPPAVSLYAKELLKKLESTKGSTSTTRTKIEAPSESAVRIFEPVEDDLSTKIKERIRNTDPNKMTPLEALVQLVELKKWIDNQQ